VPEDFRLLPSGFAASENDESTAVHMDTVDERCKALKLELAPEE